MDSTLKILLFASDPIDSRKLNIAGEVRGIEKAINESPFREFMELKVVWNAQPEDLLREICKYHPQIVHYSGRGTRQGLIMHGRYNKSRLLEFRKLLAILAQIKDEVELLFLNSCFSSARSKELAGIINRVVCIEGYADDKAAVVFPEFFYRFLGYGYSAERSLQLAKTELEIRNIKNGYKPLYVTNHNELETTGDNVQYRVIDDKKMIPLNLRDFIKKEN